MIKLDKIKDKLTDLPNLFGLSRLKKKRRKCLSLKQLVKFFIRVSVRNNWVKEEAC